MEYEQPWNMGKILLEYLSKVNEYQYLTIPKNIEYPKTKLRVII